MEIAYHGALDVFARCAAQPVRARIKRSLRRSFSGPGNFTAAEQSYRKGAMGTCTLRRISKSSDVNCMKKLIQDDRFWAAIPLRLIVGYGFMAHGYAKVVNGPGRFAVILHGLGVPHPELMAWLTILVELAGGLAVLTGTLVRLASVPMAAVLLVATFTVHLQYGFSSIKLQAVTATGPQFGKPGIEVNLLYLACLAALVVGGSGPFSIDEVRQRMSRRVAC